MPTYYNEIKLDGNAELKQLNGVSESKVHNDNGASRLGRYIWQLETVAVFKHLVATQYPII